MFFVMQDIIPSTSNGFEKAGIDFFARNYTKKNENALERLVFEMNNLVYDIKSLNYGELNPETGKRKPSTKRGFKTKKEAQHDAAKTEREIAEGTFIGGDKQITFEQVYLQWFETN